jgi:hypothetical protein
MDIRLRAPVWVKNCVATNAYDHRRKRKYPQTRASADFAINAQCGRNTANVAAGSRNFLICPGMSELSSKLAFTLLSTIELSSLEWCWR